MASAEIITIGTEILLGEIVDTNTRFLARGLRALGVDLYRTITIGDNTERIVEAIRDSMSRAQIVITTGGLGPTIDDPTREAVARAVGVESEFREELWTQIAAMIARYGRAPTENQKRQAYVPQGAIAIENPVGTAPSFIVEFNSPLLYSGEGLGRRVEPVETVSGAIIALPGVPQEMEYLFEKSVAPYLQKHFDLNDVIKVRLLHAVGMSEAAIDEQVGEFELLSNPSVGLAAHSGIIDIRITAKAKSETEANRMIAEIETQARARLGEVIFGADDETLEQAAFGAAASGGWNVAVLESALGGELTRRLAGESLSNLFGVEAAEIESGALKESTQKVREKFSAKVALGVALFPSETEQVIELCLLTPKGETTRRLTYAGPPKYAPRWASSNALNLLRLSALRQME